MDELLQRQIEREKKNRKREIASALLLICLVCIGTWGQTEYFGTDSWHFLVLLNLNALLMLVVFYFAVRNIIKLIAERRRKVFGSRLRTRLLLAFGSLSLIPVLLMFLAANRVVITSIDYWFTSTVASSMEAALSVGQSIYSTATERISKRVDFIAKEISSLYMKNTYSTPNSNVKNIKKYLRSIQGLLGENILALVRYEKGVAYIEFTLPQNYETNMLMQQIRHNTPWSQLENQQKTSKNLTSASPYTALISIKSKDFCTALLPIEQSNYFIIVAENLGHIAQARLEDINTGFKEYTYLKSFKQPLKLSFSLILGLLGLIMIFSSIFMAFRLSKELTAPIEALAKGTDRVAHGELDVLLEDTGKDELGQLVESFNAMTKQVRITNENINLANFQLAHRNLFIENLLENIATGVFVINFEGKIVSMNKAACSIFHTKSYYWLGRNPSEYFPAKEQGLFFKMLDFLKDNPEKNWRQEIEFVRHNRSLKLLFTALISPTFTFDMPEHENQITTHNPIQQDNIIILVEDITELTRVERLAAWREVAKRIAHEIKNPLTPIRLSAERLQRKFNSAKPDATFSECTKLIITEVERMQEMITNFTNFAQIPEINLKQESIHKMLAESLQIFKASHTHIEWLLDLPQEEVILPIHAKSFKQALMNIYLNASEAVKNSKKPQVITTLELTKDFCKISIADNGTGLSDEALIHLFDPYYSKKKEGQGLGLAIVQATFAEHKASIHAENNTNGGTSMIIIFKLDKE